MKEEAIELIKPVFEKYEATRKEKAMIKEEVIAEIEDKNQANQYFNYLKKIGIIKKSQGKFYYVIENENKEIKRNKNSKTIWIVLAVLFAFIIICSILLNSKQTTNTVSNTDVQFIIPSTWNILYDYEEEYGWDYYRYINTLPDTEEITTNTIDFEHYPARINVYYTEMAEEYKYSNIDEMKEEIMNYYETELQVEDYEITESKSKKGYDMLIVISKKDNYYNCAYYLLNEKNIAYITGFSYSIEDETELQKDIKSIANSFEWIK